MALFGFQKERGHSVVLIDVEPSSVGGALVHASENTPPTICYATRSSIKAHEGEAAIPAMMRTLEEKVAELIQKGAPVLRSKTGSGHTDHIVVRIGPPWQKTLIRHEIIQQPKNFTFNAAMEREMIRKHASILEGYENTGETVIATLLNGYEVGKPYGKQAKQAELMVLSSFVQKEIYASVQQAIRSAYHTHSLTFTTPAIIDFTVFRSLFPHEKNFLTVEITSETTDMSYIKSGILTKNSSIEHGINEILRNTHKDTSSTRTSIAAQTIINPNENARFSTTVQAAETDWVEKLKILFQEFAAEQALPRTIFVVAPESARDYLVHLLDNESIRSLWLSDEPLRIIGVAPSHLAPFLHIGADADLDIFLSVFALFEAKAIHTPLLKG